VSQPYWPEGTPHCPCGHVLPMCHRENARRWCGGDNAVRYEAALRKIVRDLEWVFPDSDPQAIAVVTQKTAREALNEDKS
jgi:hypothetical protein